MYGNWLTHGEKGLKTNPLPRRSINREARRDAMANHNLPSFISKNSMNNPFGAKSKALILSGEQAETTRLFWEATKVPSNSMETMMIRTRSLEEISKKIF